MFVIIIIQVTDYRPRQVHDNMSCDACDKFQRYVPSWAHSLDLLTPVSFYRTDPAKQYLRTLVFMVRLSLLGCHTWPNRRRRIQVQEGSRPMVPKLYVFHIVWFKWFSTGLKKYNYSLFHKNEGESLEEYWYHFIKGYCGLINQLQL